MPLVRSDTRTWLGPGVDMTLVYCYKMQHALPRRDGTWGQEWSQETLYSLRLRPCKVPVFEYPLSKSTSSLTTPKTLPLPSPASSEIFGDSRALQVPQQLIDINPLIVADMSKWHPILRQPIIRQSRHFHKSRMLLRVKEEEHSAHTITQRLKSLKKIPPELLPLGVVVAFAVFAACFAMGKKLFTDRTLRLNRTPKNH